jgi:hypothetical protein
MHITMLPIYRPYSYFQAYDAAQRAAAEREALRRRLGAGWGALARSAGRAWSWAFDQ